MFAICRACRVYCVDGRVHIYCSSILLFFIARLNAVSLSNRTTFESDAAYVAIYLA